jgi:hypothetical protein
MDHFILPGYTDAEILKELWAFFRCTHQPAIDRYGQYGDLQNVDFIKMAATVQDHETVFAGLLPHFIKLCEDPEETHYLAILNNKINDKSLVIQKRAGKLYTAIIDPGQSMFDIFNTLFGTVEVSTILATDKGIYHDLIDHELDKLDKKE